MRTAFLQFWDRVLRRLLLSEYRPVLIFVRAIDGAEVSLDWLGCVACKNYFWVQHSEIENPVCCPYCTQSFKGVRLVSNEEAAESQVI